MLTRKRTSVSKSWFKTVGIVAKLQSESSVECLRHLLPVFKEMGSRNRKIKFFVEPATFTSLRMRKSFLQPMAIDRMAEHCDLLIAIGGDGTILRCARYLLYKDAWKRCHLLGINAGHLGFLTFVPAHEAKKILGDTLSLRVRPKIVKRACLEVGIERNRKIFRKFHVLNDAVISKGSLSRIFEFNVEVDREFLSSYRADGLIVSSPTGSTAYNIAAGGSILDPTISAIQLTPICPQSFSNKPIVLSDQHRVDVSVGRHSSDVYLTLDGHTGLRIEPQDRVRIEKSSKHIQFLLPPGMDWTYYFHSLRQKLKWGLVSGAPK